MDKDLKQHWNTVYEKTALDELGWYEENPEPSMRLIKKCGLHKNAALLNVGAGATTLIDTLLKNGYKNIIVNDLSSIALEKLKTNLAGKSDYVRYVIDDITQPTLLNNLEPVDLWHDRAVLHFFNDIAAQDAYFELLKRLVKPNGFVIIAVFNLNGAAKCSGLPVYRYDENMLLEKLGMGFDLIEAFDHTYQMPSGEPREYVYALFKRIK